MSDLVHQLQQAELLCDLRYRVALFLYHKATQNTHSYETALAVCNIPQLDLKFFE